MSSVAASDTASAARRLAVAWEDSTSGTGMIQALAVRAPWDYASEPLEVGSNPRLRFAEQRLFVLSPTDDSLQIVDPEHWNIERTYALPAGTAPTDIAVLDALTVYVSPNNSNQLLRLDLVSGDVTPYVDLSPLFDHDVMADLGTMIVHGDRLFVQIQQATSTAPAEPDLPGSLAVIDLTTGQLIDADPVLPGTQPIALAGTGPKFKMQVVPSTDELFVSATGSFFDDGGIEVIDLNTLASQGLVIAEADGNTAADLSAFVMVTPEDGFLTFSTDFATSSHLHQFSRVAGVDPLELHVSVPYLAPGLIYDTQTGQVFLPQGGFSPAGIQVFDAFSGAQLSEVVIAVGDDPTDLVLFEVVPEPGLTTLLIGLALVACFLRPSRHH
jgi:hypothetical protein